MALKQNIIYVYFKGKHLTTSKSQYQYNHGQFLYFADLDLPQAFEVHFSNEDKGYSKPKVGSNKLVEIPDEYFWSGASQIYAWVYLHSDTDDGETIYEVKIPLTKRAKPTDEEPLPQQESAMERAIAELNNAVEITTENANKTEEDKTQVENIRDEVVDLKENIDATAETVAQESQEAIDASRRSEASAQNAAEFEEGARRYSEDASQSAQEALESKNTAKQKAQVANDASAEALGYRDETKGYRDETLNIRNDVNTLKGQIDETASEIQDTSATISENARDASLSADRAEEASDNAQESAERARTLADNASASASASASSATQSTQSANQSAQIKADINGMVDDVRGYAQTATDDADRAEQARNATEQYSNNAEGYANSARQSADESTRSSADAKDSADEARQSVETISGYKQVTLSSDIYGLSLNERGQTKKAETISVSFSAWKGSERLNITNVTGVPTLRYKRSAPVPVPYNLYSDETYGFTRFEYTLEKSWVIVNESTTATLTFTAKDADDNVYTFEKEWSLCIVKDGESGEGGLNIAITSPNVVIHADSDGYTTTDVIVEPTISAFKGGSTITYSATSNSSITALMKDGTVRMIMPSITTQDYPPSWRVPKDAKLTSNMGSLNIEITADGRTFNLSYGYAVVKDGKQGEPATDMDIHICSASEYDSETRIPTITSPDDKTFYLVPTEDGTSPDLFTEWVYVNNAWEMFGSAKIDLSGYLTDVQINGTSIVEDGVANVPLSSTDEFGVVKVIGESYGITSSVGRLFVSKANDAQVQSGTNNFKPIVPSNQHSATFYGLAKASGDTTQSSSDNAVGTYTDEAKASIKNMLGVQDNMVVTVEQNETSDWQADKTYTEIRNELIKGINIIVSDDTYLLPYVGQLYQNNISWFAFGISTVFNNTNILFGYLIGDNNGQTIVTQINQNTPIPQIDDLTTSGSSVWSSGKIKDELNYKVSDVQIDGTSIIADGVASIPMADDTHLGAVVVNGAYGIGRFGTNGALYINTPTSAYIKSGTNSYRPIVPKVQHESVFYGLAKIAGHDENDSTLEVGTYTDEAKTAIKQMLGVHDAYDSFVEEVTGTDVTITGQPSYRYNCGEVLSLSITPPSSGTIDIRFTSGSTPTVLTLPQTVKMPEWWVEVEANTIYEMCITDGIYCGVMTWAI